jgi:hypothetical protein
MLVSYLRDGYVICRHSISVIVMLLTLFGVLVSFVCAVCSCSCCVARVVLFLHRRVGCVLLTDVLFLQYSQYWVICINVGVVHV